MTQLDMDQRTVRDLVPTFHASIGVGPSQIHGIGVLAQSCISPGQMLMRFGGVLLPAALRRDSRVLDSTAIGVAESVILAESVGADKDLSDYLNHSCAPNSGLVDAVTLVATTEIGQGVEITVDYAYWEFDETWTLKHPCQCGSGDCRHSVSGCDWRSQIGRASCRERV